ncbi:cytochrome P450 [Dactylosporangium sp. CA-092794]|uniref:cytochrome P450 n=1 Tax=Dactylosporangium sp. CA-092794 TaxID=3239929 RepID=UPI003D8E3108
MTVTEWVPSTAMQEVATGTADTVLSAYETILADRSVARYDDGEGNVMWGIFSYEEAEKAAVDSDAFSSVTVPEGAPRILPLMSDPPEHSAYKRLFNSCFRPDRIAVIETRMRPVAAELIDAMIGAGTADVGAQLAYEFPTRTLCEFIGLGDEWKFYGRWASEMEKATAAGVRNAGERLPEELMAEVTPPLLALINARREAPGDDAISRIVTAGLDGAPLTDNEVVGLVIALFLAGLNTTASGIGNLVYRLARDQEAQQFLREHPDRIADAIEEGVRLDSPQQEMPRRAKRDVEVAGSVIPAGSAVFLNYGSANVDPKSWENPDVFDLDRPDKRRHLAFGRGQHSCPGAPLGRMQMRVVLEELLSRTASFSVAGPVQRLTWPRLSVERLPLRLVPAHAA